VEVAPKAATEQAMAPSKARSFMNIPFLQLKQRWNEAWNNARPAAPLVGSVAKIAGQP
jgi:hypothetical protein